MKRLAVALTLGCLCAVFNFAAFELGKAEAQKAKDPVIRPRPVTKEKAKEVPTEGTLYVWQKPEVGLQTLLVLKVIDGKTFEGAYLVPVRVEIDGATATPPKESLEKLDGLIGGRLVNASLKGRSKSGDLLGDIHFGEPKKDEPAAPSGWLTDWLKKK